MFGFVQPGHAEVGHFDQRLQIGDVGIAGAGPELGDDDGGVALKVAERADLVLL